MIIYLYARGVKTPWSLLNSSVIKIGRWLIMNNALYEFKLSDDVEENFIIVTILALMFLLHTHFLSEKRKKNEYELAFRKIFFDVV